MGKMRLNDAFWHPRLGLVVSYLFVHEGNTVMLPDGTVWDTSFVKRENMALSDVTEEGAPFIVEHAKSLEDAS